MMNMPAGRKNKRMKKSVLLWMLAIGVCVGSCACGKKEEASAQDQFVEATDGSGEGGSGPEGESRPEGEISPEAEGGMESGAEAEGTGAAEGEAALEELTGSIEELTPQGFVINRIETTQEEDDVLIAVENIVDKQLETVTYSENVPVTIRRIRNGGASYTDETGKLSDLETGQTVELKGIRNKDSFEAQSVRINIVEQQGRENGW